MMAALLMKLEASDAANVEMLRNILGNGNVGQQAFNNATAAAYRPRQQHREVDRNHGKPFDCDVCHRGFTQGSHLRRHMKIHAGLKPFQCDVCFKTFARNDNLTRHKQMHNRFPFENLLRPSMEVFQALQRNLMDGGGGSDNPMMIPSSIVEMDSLPSSENPSQSDDNPMQSPESSVQSPDSSILSMESFDQSAENNTRQSPDIPLQQLPPDQQSNFPMLENPLPDSSSVEY